jgi:hypothetical protein
MMEMFDFLPRPMLFIEILESKFSGFADEHSKWASAVHSLSSVLMSSPLPRRASFFAAPKKEGKKRAF